MATPPTANFSVVRVLAVGIFPPLMLWGIFSLWPGSLVTFIILAIPLTTLVASIPLRASEAPVAESLLAALLSALAIGAFAIAQFWSDSSTYTLILAGVPLLAMTPSLILAARGSIPRVTTAFAAAIVLIWAIIHGLGFGLYHLVPATILVVAAAAAFRTDVRTATSRALAPASSL